MQKLWCMSSRWVQSPDNNATIATNCQFTGAKWPPSKCCDAFLIAIFQRRHIWCVRCVNFDIIINRSNGQFENVWMPSHASNRTILPVSENDRLWLETVNVTTQMHSIYLVCEYSVNILIFWLSVYGQISWLNCLALVKMKLKPRKR